MPAFIPQKLKGLLQIFFLPLLAGILVPLGFAPFRWPLCIYLGFAIFYQRILKKKQSFWTGFAFGLGFFGFGISWVSNSIHDFGHLNYSVSFLLTFLLVCYLSLYTALCACALKWANQHLTILWPPFTFAVLWTVFELLRAHLLGGFPWLLIGFSQIDTPLAHLLPLIGVYGTGFFAVWGAALITEIFQTTGFSRMKRQLGFLSFFVIPVLLPTPELASGSKKNLSVAVIQSNLSMRDKWDESLYWQILSRYNEYISKTLRTGLIVLPESAIPLPVEYVENYLEDIHKRARKTDSAILLGIPQVINRDNVPVYYNSLQVLGHGAGQYLKQHLVPFGEYIPAPFSFLKKWEPLQSANLEAGSSRQKLPYAHNAPFAALICYELAFGEILRRQLPLAQWIVSISDDGWFGRSLAPYQQQQMAQVRSLQTGRYQIMANNDGLSAVINAQGKVIDSLPAFSSGLLLSRIVPMNGMTPWVRFGDWPVILFLGIILLFSLAWAVKLKFHLGDRNHYISPWR